MSNPTIIRLHYGHTACWECELDPSQVRLHHRAPAAVDDLREAIRNALANPLDYPPISQAVLAEDRITLVVERFTPETDILVQSLWELLSEQGVQPENVTILQPGVDPELSPTSATATLTDPRSLLPPEVRQAIQWRVHEPAEEGSCRYLASTSTGERVYLAEELTDADVLMCVGPIAYDPVIGYRGTSSVFYPGLSDAVTIQKLRGQGHAELAPSDIRPLRQTMDEVGWLLGTQIAVQVIPASQGGVSQVIAGLGETVFRVGQQTLTDSWMVELDHRAEFVIAAVDADAAGHGWTQLGAAAAAAQALVAREGKILLLTQLNEPPGPGIQLIQQSLEPGDAIAELRAEMPEDVIPATQLANAANWGNVYLLSDLKSDLVEELFLIPVENETEAARLLEAEENIVLIESAQHTHGQIRE